MGGLTAVASHTLTAAITCSCLPDIFLTDFNTIYIYQVHTYIYTKTHTHTHRSEVEDFDKTHLFLQAAYVHIHTILRSHVLQEYRYGFYVTS